MADDATLRELFADDQAPDYRRQFRRGGLVKRISWAFLVALLLAGFAGLLGSGPLSASVARGDGFALEYERFVRRQAETELTFRLERAGEIWLDRRWLEGLKVEAVTPEPDRQRAESDRAVFSFDLAPPTSVVFRVRPMGLGSLPARAGLSDGGAVEIWQFSYP